MPEDTKTETLTPPPTSSQPSSSQSPSQSTPAEPTLDGVMSQFLSDPTALEEALRDDPAPSQPQQNQSSSAVSPPPPPNSQRPMSQSPADGQPRSSSSADGRDYTGLNPEEIALFRNMNNAAYNKLRPIYEEHKKFNEEREKFKTDLAEAQKGKWFEVENAWELEPSIRDLSAGVSRLGAEAEFWQSQLAEARAGRKVSFLKVVDGTIQATEPVDVTPELEAKIHANLTKAIQYHAAADAELTSARNGFAGQYKTYNDELAKVRHTIFGQHDKVLGKYREQELQQFPPVLRSRPEVQALAESFVIMKLQSRIIAKLEAKANAGKLNSGARNGSITEAVVSPNGSGGTADDVAEFKRLMGGKLVR